MKRVTREWLESWTEHSPFHPQFADILDSDARQRAEIRRLRSVLLKISVGPHGIDQYGHCSYRRAAALALAPKRRARK